MELERPQFGLGWRPQTDEALVAAVLAGHHSMFELLMRRYNQRVFRAARALVKNNDEAEEIVQQAWISAWENLKSFRGNSRFSTWVIRIAMNACLMRARHHGRCISIDDTDIEAPESAAAGPERTIELKQLARFIERAADALPEGQRAVFILRDVEEMNTAETAEALEVSEEVVKTRLHRARAAIQDEILRAVGQGEGDAFTFGSQHCDRVVASVMTAIERLGSPNA